MSLENKVFYVVRDIIGVEYATNPEQYVTERQQKQFDRVKAVKDKEVELAAKLALAANQPSKLSIPGKSRAKVEDLGSSSSQTTDEESEIPNSTKF